MTAGAPTAARVLLKQRSEDQSIGRSSISTGLATGSPSSPSEDASVVGRGTPNAAGAEDDHSDKGTYTIELENRNPEEEEARRMIDKVGPFVQYFRLKGAHRLKRSWNVTVPQNSTGAVKRFCSFCFVCLCRCLGFSRTRTPLLSLTQKGGKERRFPIRQRR